MKCASCSLAFTNPRPDEKSIGAFYDNPEYVSHTDTQEGLLFRLYAVVKSYTLGRKRALLNSFGTSKSLLDYGAGSGDFSNEMQSSGWTVTSYEPDSNARSSISKKNPEIQLIDSIESLPDDSKSVIALWHVLEHVHQLRNTLDQFNRILSPEGRLIIAVPNHLSYDAQFYDNEWAAYDVPRHLYHFDQSSMETLLGKSGFRLVKTKPMWFDSFYVSLLSEKNIGNTGGLSIFIGWGRAFLVGIVSNLKALGSTKKCSSITYIFEKVN